MSYGMNCRDNFPHFRIIVENLTLVQGSWLIIGQFFTYFVL